MSNIITRLLPFAALLFVYAGNAGAQQSDPQAGLKLGDAVVTGFSGTVAAGTNQRPAANRSATDLTFIDPDGASVRVIDVSRPGYVWDGRLFAAPKKFDVSAKDVGQVFGIALDDAAAPNIYVAATSVFGLNIVSRSRDGSPQRRKKGGPGAGWMKGQFGLELQGGPGAIYRIDGRSGIATLFANVTLNGVPNPGPGLGNLAYDAAHKQLFVSDLYTGMIHRFDLDGKELGGYDHGTAGRDAAKLAPVPFNPGNRPNIASDRFDTEQPDTWGYAPAPRQVWGLAVHDGRLYYSVVAGPQIWSIGIASDGNFAADPRWELDVAVQAAPLPVSDIAFSQKGAMILAQRAPVAGAYDYSAFTAPGEPRVLRYRLESPDDPNTPSRWVAAPEEYAIGFAGSSHNSNGGIALGYGYGQDGTLSATACEASLWSTGQNLRNNPAMRGQLEPGGPLVVHGLQGSPVDLVGSANTPPAASYFVDYDDQFDDPQASGHIGSVRILAQPCAPPVIATRMPAMSSPSAAAAGGGIITTNACTPTCVCPAGTVLKDGDCVKTDICPSPMVTGPDGSCVCPPHYRLINGQCLPEILASPIKGCTPPLVPGATPDSCVCPPGTQQQPGGRCIQVSNVCKAPLVPGPCEPSGEQAVLEVHKRVVNLTHYPLSPTLPFQLSVSCAGAPSFVLINGGLYTINNIPIGTSCLVTELPPPMPNVCPRGWTPSWSTTFVPPPNPVIIHAGLNVITAVNTFDCKRVKETAELEVIKKVVNLSPVSLSGLLYQFSVDCGGAPPFSIPDTGSHTINNIPIPSSCNVTEVLPTVTTCPRGTTPSWSTNYSPPVPLNMHPGLNPVVATNTFSCKKIEPGVLEVHKKVAQGPFPVPSTLQFQFTASCGGGPFSLTDGGMHSINNVPVGSSCTLTELLPTANVCPRGMTPSWSTSYSPSNPIITHPGTTVVTAINKLDCKKPIDPDTGVLEVHKKVENHSPIPLPSGLQFQFTASCGGGSFPLTDGGMHAINLIPVGSSCTLTEVLPTANVCPRGMTPSWSTSYSPSNPIVTHPGTTVVTAINTLDCKKTVVCEPPMVPNAAGGCDCPPGTVRRGNECIKLPPPVVCKPPMIAGAVPGVCVCPDGKVQRGGRCVEPVTCRRPATLNRNGTDCLCPEGMSKKGNTCVQREKKKEKKKKEQERRQPNIQPRDLNRGFPGGFGPGRGGGGGSGGGSGGSPGKR